MNKVHNFSPGPCILPEEVIKQASESILNFNNLNLSLIEISHRSKDFVEVMEEAKFLVKELLNITDDYEVLFLQGGASLGFLIAAMNFSKAKGGKTAYLDTGVWSTKAIKEAKKVVGKVDVVASGSDKDYKYIPKNYNIPTDIDYFHYTTNNTIHGTQVKECPKTNVPIIADMSSDIFSKKIEVSKYAMIYAGAQKNMGPAGTTLYIVKKSMLGHTERNIPSMLDLEIHIKKKSMFNTPPVFSVYTSMLTLKWLKKLGGIQVIENINNQKADLLYNELDNNSNFEIYIKNKEDRSLMSITFDLVDKTRYDDFNKLLEKNNISGLKGHRDVGGYRASLYNALPLKSVEHLVNLICSFK